jgi:methylated-DNA-[protein]-cysteine S-methyltransferase
MTVGSATAKSEGGRGGGTAWDGTFECAGRLVRVELTASDHGLMSVRLEDADAAVAIKPAAPQNPHLAAAVAQLRDYFAGGNVALDVPLDVKGTPFQKKAWKAARRIPAGQTRSYWWLAVRLGDPRAARAVGGAMGANPVPLFVPCHRVVRRDNSLGGFSCGIEWKEMLLAHEAATKAG